MISLFRVQPPQERGDLRSRAVIGGAEQPAADAVGDAVLLGPRHSLRIVSVRRYVAEPGAAADRGAARRAVQERRGLGAGAGGVRTEQAIARTAGDAVFNGPRYRLGVVAACGNIRKAGRALRLGRTGRHRKVTIWARVQFRLGLKVVSVVPWVTSRLSIHSTAST